MRQASSHPVRIPYGTNSSTASMCSISPPRTLNSVLIAELFKVRRGLIEHIEAVLEFVPYGMRTGWEEA